ncbi:MAG: hypothetical protein M3446_04325 [Actinomycetota bacterium]|nr:hypothetical protein [Actinomycetota bacterium]
MSAPAAEALGGPGAEARRLVEALGDWAASRLAPVDEHLATGSAECRVCPLCQVIAALRGDRAEVLDRVGDAWTAFLGVLSEHPRPGAPTRPPTDGPAAAASKVGPDAGADGGADAPTDGGPDGEQPIRAVQHIVVR